MNRFRLAFSVLAILLVVIRWKQYFKIFHPLLLTIKKSQIKSKITQRSIIDYFIVLFSISVPAAFLIVVYLNVFIFNVECFLKDVEFESFCWNIVLMLSPLLSIMDSIPKQLVENNIKDMEIFTEERNKNLAILIEESIKQSKFPVIIPPEDCQAASKKGIEAVKNRRQ